MEAGKLTPIAKPTEISRAQDLFARMASGDISRDEWNELGRLLSRMSTAADMMLGAWVASAKPEWGDAVELAEAVTKQPRSKLKAYQAVFLQLDFCADDLTFNHHQILTELPPKDQAEWAQRARDENMDYGELRRAIREYIGHTGDAQEAEDGPRRFYNPDAAANDFIRWANREDFRTWPAENLRALKSRLEKLKSVIERIEQFAPEPSARSAR